MPAVLTILLLPSAFRPASTSALLAPPSAIKSRASRSGSPGT